MADILVTIFGGSWQILGNLYAIYKERSSDEKAKSTTRYKVRLKLEYHLWC